MGQGHDERGGGRWDVRPARTKLAVFSTTPCEDEPIACIRPMVQLGRNTVL